MTFEVPLLDAHRDRLRAEFTAWLAGFEPKTVLDVGAGQGQLVRQLCAAGVDARGIEPEPEAVERAASSGLPILAGSATALAEADQSVSWVSLRHILHHLPDPADAIREAIRVASRGVMIAEPTCATELPQHTAMAPLERLLRRLDRARGMFHEDEHPLGEILDWLPPSWEVEVRTFAPLTRLPAPEVEALLAKSLGDGTLSNDDRATADEALRAAKNGRLAAPGSVVIALQPPNAH